MTDDRTRRPRRSRLGLVIVILAILVGAKLAIDWALTPSLSAADLAFVAQPYTVYGLKPSFTRQGEPRRSSNAQGTRGAPVELPKPQGRFRIACLGGSTTYGFAVADDESYPARLEHHLRAARPDLDLDVVNAGVESYTSAESLANLAMRVLDLQPDMIVVYQSANDVRVRRYANFEPGYAHYRKPWNGSPDGYRVMAGELAGINQFIQLPPPEPAGDPMQNLARAGTAAYRRNLLSMVGVARIHGVQPVLVTFAVDEQKARPEMLAGCREQDEVMRVLAAEHDVALVDLAAVFPRTSDMFVDSVHLDARGCDEKARVVAEGLAALLP